MKLTSSDLPGLLIAEPQVFRDERGFLMDTWHANKFANATIFYHDGGRSLARRPAYAMLDKTTTIADFGLILFHSRITLRQMLAELTHA